MDLVPTSDSVIIREIPYQEQSKGGVILPTEIAPSLAEAEVMAVGLGAIAFGHRVSSDIQAGDIIIYNKDLYPIQPIIEDGEKFLMIRANTVLAYRRSARGKTDEA
ncbi:MAG: hypothetical protein ABIC57_04270 [bacterium]